MNDGRRKSEAVAAPRINEENRKLRFKLPTFRQEKFTGLGARGPWISDVSLGLVMLAGSLDLALARAM
jgi:hypothetical protein